MECTDLMLDDWVLDTYTGKPMRVPRVNIKVGKGLEPIPLTVDILEKNGFVFDYTVDECVADYQYVELKGYICKGKTRCGDDYLLDFCNGMMIITTDFCGEVKKEMRYVHQLQHALLLCEIDKEIEV